MSKKTRVADNTPLIHVDRDCRRCKGTGDDGPSQCRDCLGQGTVCRDHGSPDCLDCHAVA